MIETTANGERVKLTTPSKLPKASGFLWNKHMMIHLNCRGYAVAQFMQPEPAKYAHAPNLEAKTFMQPEQPYYAHHPGRFVYIKNETTSELFSGPYAPIKAPLDKYEFSVGKSDLAWKIQKGNIELTMELSLAPDEPIELWEISVKNKGQQVEQISLYPYFPVGYMSWMNQSGEYLKSLNGIICSCVTPYQKYKDYPRIKTLKDKTFFLADTIPTSWEVNQETFEGEGGLHNPTGIVQDKLENGDARYETPACIMQYQIDLEPGSSKPYRFLFGPARTNEEVEVIKARYFNNNGFDQAREQYQKYVADGKGNITIDTPDPVLNNFVNHWLPRQMFYHGETNRLTTDPQTRNYLQDNMGYGYLIPEGARTTYLTALRQQFRSGEMPDGILIHPDAELKYINQVPHTDHCVWLPICMQAYLDETNDYGLLQERLPFADSDEEATVAEHMDLAMEWLLKSRDERGLNYINQGDWCDPMNMVGPKGKGVSGWLSLGTAYALQTWATICELGEQHERAKRYRLAAQEVVAAVNEHLWDGKWYARGITDDNVPFGISTDTEGKIFLNPQAWALLCDAASSEQQDSLINAVEDQLESPYGVEMLGPPFSAMREDVGRVTQKFPGSAENGSIYNHAAAFYIYGLYSSGYGEKAFRVLRKMIPGPDEADYLQRGQLPVFIPNYYRGGFKEFPRTAGRSSQLFNTGTVAWVYRSLIDGLFGLRGHKEGLMISPQLPSGWDNVKVVRQFRQATYHIHYKRLDQGVKQVLVNGAAIAGIIIPTKPGEEYQVVIEL